MTTIFASSWPWYIAGPLIGLMVPLLLILDNKQFGISSTLRDFCALITPKPLDYLNYNIREYLWRNILVAGILTGGAIAIWLTPGAIHVSISPETVSDLHSLGIRDFSGLVPDDIFSWSGLFTLKGLILVVVGGFLIGFGTRWADGFTSGHAITGLSLFSRASLLAVIGFFTGGLVATHLLFPLILK